MLKNFLALGISMLFAKDQAAIMPNGGAQARSEAMAELAVISHELATADYLDAIGLQKQRQKISHQSNVLVF